MMKYYSVLMSVYYKEDPDNFKTAIESILNQSVKTNDFVIVCDGDLTPELNLVIDSYVEKYNIFNIIRLKENKGLGLALAEGLVHCKNELVARMDSDDISVYDRMEFQLEYLEKNPDVDILGGQIDEFIGKEENVIASRVVPTNTSDIRKMIAHRNPVNHVTVMFKKSNIIKVGNYQSCIGFEDYYLWSRALVNGLVISNCDKVCCKVRVDEKYYMRRGGIKYFSHTKNFEKKLFNLGLITRIQYIKNIIERFIATVCIPNFVRGFLFKKIMRK